MDHTYDVAVIGGGIAGGAAALGASAQGARVCVVQAGPGATGLCSGAWGGPLAEPLGRALAQAGLAHEPCERPLPHPTGEYRACTFAPAAHAAARVDGDTLICGIAGLPAFHAAALARLWASEADGEPSSALLVLEGTPQAGWSPVSLAALLDRDAAPLAAPLTAAVRESGARRVVLPAVLGIDNTTDIRATLAAAAGVEVAEALGVAPSLPGWRLARALERALRDAGVEIITGRAAHAANGNGRVASVDVVATAATTKATTLSVRASCFVLATGKFAGGGIAGDASFSETALGCPVWVDHLGRRFDAPNPLALTNAERLAPQPILSAGVHTDGEGRPVHANGDVVYADVIVAGSVRAGVTTAGLGLGGAAQDGWAAGVRAAISAR